jgi:hypothetical protein
MIGQWIRLSISKDSVNLMMQTCIPRTFQT